MRWTFEFHIFYLPIRFHLMESNIDFGDLFVWSIQVIWPQLNKLRFRVPITIAKRLSIDSIFEWESFFLTKWIFCSFMWHLGHKNLNSWSFVVRLCVFRYNRWTLSSSLLFIYLIRFNVIQVWSRCLSVRIDFSNAFQVLICSKQNISLLFGLFRGGLIAMCFGCFSILWDVEYLIV